MKKKFIEEQIIKIFEKAKTGLTIQELCRKHNIAIQTYYAWKNKFNGMNISDAQKLRRI